MSSSETLAAESPLRRAYLGAHRSTLRGATAAVLSLAVALAPTCPAVAQGESLREEARRAYAELRLEDAWSAVARALAELDVEGSDSAEERTEVLVLAAEIARARGEVATADAMLDRLIELTPDVVLDPALHPPPVLEALELRRRRRRALAMEASTGSAGSEPAIEPSTGAPAPAIAMRVLPLPEETAARGEDPWPWIGGGIAASFVLGGAIAVAIVFTQPPSTFELRGTIAP